MRNRALHDALRNFALEAAALLTEDLKAGAEVEFDVIEEEGIGAHRAPPGASARRGGRGPALYRYEPRTGAFIEERWPRLRELPSSDRACQELGAGASAWLRVNGLRGEQAEPALRAMLERLYEDSTSFGFPEERFERVYSEVELTLYRDAVRARVIAPLWGAWMEADRVDLGDGLALVRGDRYDAPAEAVFAEDAEGEASLLCVLERDVPADAPISAPEAIERFAALLTAVRLWAPGGAALGTPGWRQADHGRWQPVAIGSATRPRGEEWLLPAGDEQAFREFFTAISAAPRSPSIAWALDRFEMGCAQRSDAEALSDHLLALRGLLDATTEAGQASFGPRLAALCSEEAMRQEGQERLEAALAVERFVMGGSGGVRIDAESPRELIAEIEGHLRALLRDVLCGYLEPDLKAVADDILLESGEGPMGEIEVRDLRTEQEPEREPEPKLELELEPVTFEPQLEYEYEPPPDREAELDVEQDTEELEPVTVAAHPVQHELDGVTESADWGWDDPEDFSAPV
jgi:hypothetical protein